MSAIDNSLKRLGTDYVDLYIIHRWDYNTPIEETMAALHDVVKKKSHNYKSKSKSLPVTFYVTILINGVLLVNASISESGSVVNRSQEYSHVPHCASAT